MSREGQILRTLLVEDSEMDAELILNALRRGGYTAQWKRVETADQLRSVLKQQEWDVVLCDYFLPQLEGPAALEILREIAGELPVILVSGAVGEDIAVEALKLGANDYLRKDNLIRLIPAVQRELREVENRRAGQLSEEKKRHAEKALRQSEESYRVLFERNPIPMWVYDRTTFHLLQVNQAAAVHYGYTREEFLRLSILDLRPAEDVAEFAAGLRGLPNDAPLSRGTWRHRKKDGSIIFVEVVTQPINYGGVHARIAQALDITERMRAEEELTRIKVAVEFASDVISVHDSDGSAVYLNRAHGAMFGYDIAELNALGGPNALFLNRGIAEEADASVLSQGSWSDSAFLRTKSGRVVELFLRVNAVKDAQGEVIAFIGVGTDLGQMKRAERTIAEQAALLDEAQDAIMVRDLRGMLQFWNKGAERVFGWAAAEVLGRPAQELLFEELPAYDEAMEALLRQGAWSGELTMRTKDGREVLIEGRWTLVRDDFGDPKSVLAIETDITEKKQIEMQFLRAQRMESIGTLAGGIAHDLNNVLGPIIMAVDLFKLKFTDPMDVELLETVEVSARRGAEMVKQVLSFARGLEGKRIMLQPMHLMKDVQKMVRETFPKQITVRLSANKDAWNIFGDPTQLHQVLLNLAVNARDAMPNGGRLEFACRNVTLDASFAAMMPDARPGDYVVMEVTDTGSGMPPEVMDKIFEPFFTTKEIGKGTGLGLSTTLAIARSHGGFITVDSAPGRGTTFKVHLAAVADGEELPNGEHPGDLPRGHGECILVIDDEASVRSITTQTLEAFGYRVKTANDGAEGVALYAQHASEIAVVLTDIMMPIMDGTVAIRALQKLNPAVKIIAASGFMPKGSEADAAAAGVQGFLAKPYTASAMLLLLQNILRPSG